MRVTEQPPFRSPEAQRLSDQAGPAKTGAPPRRLPSAPRERKPAMAALAVLLIVGGALLTVTLVLRSGDRVSAVQVNEYIGAGQRIPLSALKEVQIAQEGVPYIPWQAAPEVAKHYAAVDLVPGTLLNESMVSLESQELRPGRAVVGLSLKAGQMPQNLQRGQRVQVIHVPGENSSARPRVLAEAALVHSVGKSGERTTGSSTLVEVVVDARISPEIAAYASEGRIVLAYLPGVSASGGGGAGGAPTPQPSPGTPGAPEDGSGTAAPPTARPGGAAQTGQRTAGEQPATQQPGQRPVTDRPITRSERTADPTDRTGPSEGD